MMRDRVTARAPRSRSANDVAFRAHAVAVRQRLEAVGFLAAFSGI
jgi:hypothetical protein